MTIVALSPTRPVSVGPALPPIQRAYEDDPIFFHKGQIKIGTILQNVGRLENGTHWRVTRIRSLRPAPRRYKIEDVDFVHKLNDTIYLHRVGNPEMVRFVLFQTLSYSAIWRLV